MLVMAMNFTLTETVGVEAISREVEKGYDYKKLAKKWAKHLSLGHKIVDVKSDLMTIFSKLCEGIGRLLGEYKIEFKPDAKPVHLSTRNIPEALRALLKKELDRICDSIELNFG